MLHYKEQPNTAAIIHNIADVDRKQCNADIKTLLYQNSDNTVLSIYNNGLFNLAATAGLVTKIHTYI